MSVESYDKKANSYDCHRNYCPGWNDCLQFLEPTNYSGKAVLDLGCGTGIFMEKINDLSPKKLHGVDPSKDMILKAKERMSKEKNVEFFSDIPKDCKYNLIFCSQVLQNLTLDLSLIKSTRRDFLKMIFSNLLSGGTTIITTRYKNPSGYEHMYWYIDKYIMPKSLNHMNNVVPGHKELLEELKSIGFINIEYKLSNDIIYKI